MALEKNPVKQVFKELVESFLDGVPVQWVTEARPMMPSIKRATATLTWKSTGQVGDQDVRYNYYDTQHYNEQTFSSYRTATISIKVESQGEQEAWELLEQISTGLQRPASKDTLNTVEAAFCTFQDAVDLSGPQDNRWVSIGVLDVQIAYATTTRDPPTLNPGWIEHVNTVNGLTIPDAPTGHAGYGGLGGSPGGGGLVIGGGSVGAIPVPGGGGGGGGGPPPDPDPFVPTDIAGLQFWVRPDLGRVMYPAPNASYVQTLADQSGSGNNLGHDALRALYDITTGFPALLGSTGNYLETSTPFNVTSGSAARSFFCVFTVTSISSASSRPMSLNFSGGSSIAIHVDWTESGNIYIVTDSNFNSTDTLMPLNTRVLIGVIYDGAGGMKVYMNGALIKSFTGVSITHTCTNIRVSGGGFNHFGLFLEGLYYNTALSNPNRVAIETYATARYNL